MPEIVFREMTNYRTGIAQEGYERITVRSSVDAGGNLTAIKLAAQALMDDLGKFEPPIIGVNDSMIRISAVGTEILAQYIREDKTPITRVPIGYEVNGYPLKSDYSHVLASPSTQE